MLYHVLIAEDEEAILHLIQLALKSEDCVCTLCRDGAEALEKLRLQRYDLMVADVMMPRMDGFELFEALPDPPPTLFVTARTAIEDRVRGLKMGAEDYLVKPFDVAELTARAANILKRHGAPVSAVAIDGTVVDLDARRVMVDGRDAEVTPQEFLLLETLLRHCGHTLSRDQLLSEAWGYDYFGGTRTVDAHIQKLRKKCRLEDRILTVHKVGYRLSGEEETR